MPSRPSPANALLSSLLALSVAAACADTLRDRPTAQQLEESATAAQAEYVIGAQDVLAISVWKEPELTLQGVEVRLDGKISVPLIDDIQASGLTPTQLKDAITERLKEYVSAPQVTVIVTHVGSKNVYVVGEVQRQGPIALQPAMRVSDALAFAGGFNAFAGRNRVKIIRTQTSPPAEFTFDWNAFVDGHDVAQNILLLPGDQIIVPEERPFWR
jgi:polysaccharide export outer membrane protein